jgi:hypothetical protein
MIFLTIPCPQKCGRWNVTSFRNLSRFVEAKASIQYLRAAFAALFVDEIKITQRSKCYAERRGGKCRISVEYDLACGAGKIKNPTPKNRSRLSQISQRDAHGRISDFKKI